MNQPWPGPFWSKLYSSSQNKSTLEPTLLSLVILSRIVSNRNRFWLPSRSQRVPPRKAFTQEEFLRVVPVRPFICEAKKPVFTKGGGGRGGSPGWAIIPYWGYNQYLWLLYSTTATISFDSLSTKHESRFYLNILKG